MRSRAARAWVSGLAVAVLLGAGLGAGVAGAAGAPPSDVPLTVTLVARACGAYTDVSANLARNNIMESLRDLGPDTAYSPGQPINPTVENSVPSQAACSPLPGFQFTFGSGISGTVPGTNLSKVSNASTTVAARASTPLLDPNGVPTGSSIAGAVTVTLTPEQAALAQQNSRLWVQGGTPTDATGNAVFGDGAYAFAALRCAIDNLNGDNVEWVSYPTGASHVFCYYYAIRNSPRSATITVVKHVPGGDPTGQVFAFGGTVSYNPGGYFGLSAGQSASFVRAETAPGGAPWEVSETTPPGWQTPAVGCVVSGALLPGDPPTTYTITASSVAIHLGVQDITCTYTNSLPATTTTLTVDKVTEGRAGGPFAVTVTPSSGPDHALGAATTSLSGVAALVGTVAGLPLGPTVLTETVPASAAGHWVLARADCDGSPMAVSGLSARYTFTSTTPGGHIDAVCTLVNRWEPTARLVTDLTTHGGVGTAQFSVLPLTTSGQAGVGVPLVQTATTTAPGVAAVAAGDDTTALDVGTYAVIPSGLGDTATGHWVFVSASCTGGAGVVGPSGADNAVQVTLSDTAADAACHFVYRLAADPTVDVVKVVSAGNDLRAGPVTIVLACPQGERATVQLAPGADRAQLPAPLPVEAAQTCTLAETATGAPAGVTPGARYTLARAGGAVLAQGPLTGTLAVPVTDGAHVVATVDDSYVVGGVELPQTGGGGALVVLGAGLALVGAVLVTATTRRRQRS